MEKLKNSLIGLTLTGVLVLGAASNAYADHGSRHQPPAFNDEYVFATTRGLSDTDGVHPALKLSLFPVTVVLDVAFLPFAVMAGFIA